MNEPNPIVSVLTPSFNQGRFIRDCIDSVLRQSYGAIEHVVFDGGSTDETLDILRGSPSTVRWTSEPDGGQADAVNKAFRSSTGAIIGWLNSDDAFYDVEAVEAAVALFERRPDVDVVYGHAALVGADGELLHLMWVPPFHAAMLRRWNFVVQPATFVRRAALSDSLLDESYDFAMDKELWIRLFSEGRRFARLDRIVAIDRHHPTRKVYTMQEVGDREADRIAAEYGLPDWRGQARLGATFRAACRFTGVRLLRAAYRPTACAIRRPSRPSLLRRQVAMRRRSMPLREGGVSGTQDHL